VSPGAQAAGQTYRVLQCDPLNVGSADAQSHEPHPYIVGRHCDDPDRALEVIDVYRADQGDEGSFIWSAPPQTGIVGVHVEAKLRRDNGHKARLYMADQQHRQTFGVASGDDNGSFFGGESWQGPPQEQFVAALRCEDAGGCPASNDAKTLVRSVRLTLADNADPTLSVGGSLASPGWQRGAQLLSFSGDDQGSGLELVDVRVNGSELGAAEQGTCAGVIPGTHTAAWLRPCKGGVSGSVYPSTAELPFHDGGNTLSVCADDFAGNETCDTRSIQVDNTAPTLAFANEQSADDPELIRAPVGDTTSGVASGQLSYRASGAGEWTPLPTRIVAGELRARIDSTAVPAGSYEFMAQASDVAGNATVTTLRQDGLPMTLEFPLKARVRLSASFANGGSKRELIGYGRRSSVRGHLRDAQGHPLEGEKLTVVEHFGQGALIRKRISHVGTNQHGWWRLRLPAGPSRRVTVSYGGTHRYLSAKTRGGHLLVRSKATLRPSRRHVHEKKRVVFRGHIAHRGARIPNSGKLLELQVRAGPKTWHTVKEGFRTHPNGHYRIGYKFQPIYCYDVRYRFRVKVAREGDWPYKAPSTSKTKKVTVLDRVATPNCPS
jgi:hypothetical protein